MGRGHGYQRGVRKLLHIIGGAGVFALPFLPYWLIVAGVAFALLAGIFLKPRHAWWLRVMSKPADRIRGVITGLRGYTVAVLILVLLWPVLALFTEFRADAVRYVMFGWLALALGDGLAGLIGPGPDVSATVPWSRQKTWWGFGGCVAGTWLAYLICFALPWSGAAAYPLALVATLGSVVAVITALLESLDTRFDDNLLVGLGSALLAVVLAVAFF